MLATLLGTILSLTGLMIPGRGLASPIPAGPAASSGGIPTGSGEVIPVERQPFYPQLLKATERWRLAPLSEVVAESPRDTLLNFYVVMTQVDHELQAIAQLAKTDPGLFWSSAARARIDRAEERFTLAVKALDASSFPESIRDDMAEEAAMKLKEVLDYVFNNSHEEVTIPDSRELREIAKKLNKREDAWTWPETGITLSARPADGTMGSAFLFSSKTVSKMDFIYHEISQLRATSTRPNEPSLYATFSSTPGHLMPPKWYLRIPIKIRQFLEISMAEQTIFQITSSLIVTCAYCLIAFYLTARLLATYRELRLDKEAETSIWKFDDIAWRRVLLILPILPLTWLSQTIIDDHINFTGLPLATSKYLFVILYFLAASLFSFYLFEALGRSLSEWLTRLRGNNSELQFRRVSNLMMPICRMLGALVALTLIYRLLIALGLPSATVLAFSAVPGLAIGLGASKLLSNLFAGLSIQTDRPVRVGEFCRIGSNQGFVTRIGLRSLELQTIESKITIPNAIVDEETIVNYCHRTNSNEGPLQQSLELKIPIPDGFTPDQIGDLLHFMRQHVASQHDLEHPMLSIDQAPGGEHAIQFTCLIAANQWDQYLKVRERVLRRFDEICEQIRLSYRKLGVSFKTTSDQLRNIPSLIAEIVAADPMLDLKSCRLMNLSDYSYDFWIRLHTNHQSHREVKDAIDRFNQDLITSFAQQAIEIPYPTAISYEIKLTS